MQSGSGKFPLQICDRSAVELTVTARHGGSSPEVSLLVVHDGLLRDHISQNHNGVSDGREFVYRQRQVLQKSRRHEEHRKRNQERHISDGGSAAMGTISNLSDLRASRRPVYSVSILPYVSLGNSVGRACEAKSSIVEESQENVTTRCQ